MKIKNRFDRVLKMLTVFAMTLSCFTDMPIRVVAESFDVDSVISIESHNNGTDANDSEASLAVSVTVNGQTVTAPKSVAPGTLTVRANEGYEIDSMILDGTEFNESTDVQAGEHSLNITAHSTASQSNESEEIQQPDPTVEPTPTITPDPTPEVTATPEVTNTPDVTEEPTDPTANKYQLAISHILKTNIGNYIRVEIIDLSDEDFVNNIYVAENCEFVREGIKLVTTEKSISKESLDDEGQANIVFNYEIADGYELIMPKINTRSIYVGELTEDNPGIIPTEDKLVVTVKFSYETGAMALNSYTFETTRNENNEFLVDYEIPAIEGYTAELLDESNFQFTDNHITGVFAEKGNLSAEIIYKANPINYTVKHFFENDNGEYIENKELAETKLGNFGELTDAQSLSVAGYTPQSIIQTLINKEDTVVEIKYDLNVYSLTYQTNGGSYVPRQTGKYMSEITIASGSTLAGYTFEGWYTNPEFEGDSVSGNLVMTDNVTLYAKWSASSVSYNIVYLVENANDDGYSLLSTGQGTARTGSSVTVTSQQAKPSWGSLPSKAFKFERATNEIVKADGSSVVTVYYSRNEYTITIKGSRNTTYGTIKAKYGSNIADEWLSITKSHTENGTYAWEDNKGNPKLAVLDIMPSEDRTYSRTRNTSYKEETIHYYLEGYAKGNQRNFDGKTFGEYTSVDVRYNYFTKSEEFFDIDGYNQYQATNSKGNKVDFGSSSNISSGDYYFYYTRAEYTLSLINVNDRIDYKVPYTEDISDKLVEPKNKPTNDSVFEGWYIDQGLTEKFTETTMPKGLVLYAKWSAPSYDVKFVSDGVVVETRPVISGKTVDMINAPENPGYDFDGWFVDEECTQLYDFAEPVKESKVLYAGWSKRQMADYVVKYVTETGEQVAESKYGSGKVETTIVEKAVKPEGKFAEYTVDAPSKSIVLSTNSNENVITFTYYATAELTYDVIYTYEGKIIYSVLDNISDVNRIKVYPVLASEIEALQGYSINESFKWADLYYGQDNIIEFTLNVSNFEIDYKNVEDVTWKNGDLVNPNPVSYSIKDISDGKVITLVNPEKRGYAFTGWTLTKGTNPDATHDPMNTVISEGSYGNLEFTANFVIDESQTKELNYTVKHVIGEEVQETLTETQKVQVLQPDTLTRNTELEADRGYKGYKKSTVTYENGEAVEGETIANGAVIVVNYIVDAEQTTNLSYTVEYYKDGIHVEGDDQVVTKSVWSGTNMMPVDVADINVTDKYAGYDFNHSEPTTIPTEIEGGSTIKVYYTVNSYNYKVSHVYRDADNNVVEELTTTKADEKRDYLSAIAESPRGPENANGNFVLSNIEVDSVDESTLQADEEGNITGTMPAENLTITFYYDADNIGEKDPEEGDGIADKYQITVTYDAVNGKVVANQGPFVLTKYNANHEYAMDGVAYLAENQIATVEPNLGYHLTGWTPEKPTTEIALNEDTKFVATFVINEYQATVKYIDEETKAEIGTAKEVPAKHGETINGEDYKMDIEDYVYTHAESKAITEEGMIVNVYYSADENHDEIPDKYQIHVNYNAVNGTITANQGPFTLNKVNENGEYAVDGIAHLSDDQIAKASPNNGYQGGTWSPMAPTTALDLTEDITFTITFTANPADPDPVNPGCPAGTEWNEEAQACLAPVIPPVPVVPPGPGPVNPEPQPEEEVIVEPTTPEGGGEVTPTPTPEVEEIEEPEQPQVGHKGSWALINLIASLLGLLAALFLIFAKHSKEDDDEEDQNQTVAMNEEEDPEQLKRKRIYKWISGLTAVISVIVFVLTENMRLPMVLVDKWTLLMVVFFLINAVTLYLGRKWHEDEDDEEQTQA